MIGNVYNLNLLASDNLTELKNAASDEKSQEDYSEWLRRRGSSTWDLCLYVRVRICQNGTVAFTGGIGLIRSPVTELEIGSERLMVIGRITAKGRQLQPELLG